MVEGVWPVETFLEIEKEKQNSLWLPYTEARKYVLYYYKKEHYFKAEEIIKFFTEAEVITLADRTKLMKVIDTLRNTENYEKKERRKRNKERKRKMELNK